MERHFTAVNPHRVKHSEFAARASLYADWDQKLREKTRFFGAAAVTNAALVELCLLECAQRWIGDAATRLLSKVGRHLELLNIEIAERIQRGTVRDSDLDRSLVILEQIALEHVLQHEAGRVPNCHIEAIQQINRLLFCVEWCSAWPLNRWPSAHRYRRVLRRVHVELGRRPDFAVLGDRVCIGHALIRTLR